MTRYEFIDNVTTWSELLDFCYDNDCYYCENVYSEDSRDDYINGMLTEMAQNANDWQDLLDALQNIDTGYYYYIRDDYGEWSGTDDGDGMFDSYKDDVLEWMDDNGYWDDEEEEEMVEEEPAPNDEDPDDEEPVEEEDVSIAELFTTCNSKFQKIDADTEAAVRAAEKEDEEVFNDFCTEVGLTVTTGKISIYEINDVLGGNA